MPKKLTQRQMVDKLLTYMAHQGAKFDRNTRAEVQARIEGHASFADKRQFLKKAKLHLVRKVNLNDIGEFGLKAYAKTMAAKPVMETVDAEAAVKFAQEKSAEHRCLYVIHDGNGRLVNPGFDVKGRFTVVRARGPLKNPKGAMLYDLADEFSRQLLPSLIQAARHAAHCLGQFDKKNNPEGPALFAIIDDSTERVIWRKLM